MRRGQPVQLRSPAEVLATLDADCSLDGLPFMPEMLAFFGRRFTVTARLERLCDTLGWTGVRRMEDSVVLEDLRCDGSGHDGCDAGCRIFWRDAWLEPATDREPQTTDDDRRALRVLEERAREVARRPSPASAPVYRCQATELLRASKPVRWWSPTSLVREVSCGNVGPFSFVRVMTAAVIRRLGRSLGFPRQPAGRTPPAATPPEGLQPGTLVRIRSRDEIVRTLDERGTLRGLSFDPPEMGPFCGRETRITRRVTRFVDEKAGTMVELRTDAYILDGCSCSGLNAPKRWFCPRAIYPWWRGAWLEPLAQHDDAGAAPGPASDPA